MCLASRLRVEVQRGSTLYKDDRSGGTLLEPAADKEWAFARDAPSSAGIASLVTAIET